MDKSYEALLHAAIVFVRLGSIAGLFAGIGLLVQPGKWDALNRLLSRRVDVAGVAQKLSRPRWVERYFYARHQIAGGVLLIGAIVSLYAFVFSSKVHAAAHLFSRSLWWLWDAVMIIMAAFSVLAVLVSLAMLLRPDWLRKMEHQANRWVPTDRFLLMLFDVNRAFPDRYILRHRKIFGLLLIAACVYNLILLRHIP